MANLYLFNTQFERELSRPSDQTLSEAMEIHPIFLQLQFLPLLFCEAEDIVALTSLPPKEYIELLCAKGLQSADSFPKMHLLSDSTPLPSYELQSWGITPEVANWAQQHKINCDGPDPSIVRKIHSKRFVQQFCPKLPGGKILDSEKEIHDWITSFPYPKVLKSFFGTAGSGHLLLENPKAVSLQRIQLFIKKELQNHGAIIAEPWVNRLLDFSTQWRISEHRNLQFLGAVTFQNASKGIYRSTIVGKREELFGEYAPFLQEHMDFAKPLLEKIAEIGFFGNIGIDSMIYQQNGIHLHPVVEINARKTMSWVALQIYNKHFANRQLSFSYAPIVDAQEGLLPEHLVKNDQSKVLFKRQLYTSLRDFL